MLRPRQFSRVVDSLVCQSEPDRFPTVLSVKRGEKRPSNFSLLVSAPVKCSINTICSLALLPTWLDTGLHGLKAQAILVVNRNLCHQPWATEVFGENA